MKKFAVAILLFGLAAQAAVPPSNRSRIFGGSSSSSGGSGSSNVATDPRYTTQAALNLFLDPTGSDSNACTSSGASACLTPQGVENKLPRGIMDPVIINVAAGTYAGAGLQVFGHWFNARTAAAGASINWIGTLANAVPTTGTATGTATVSGSSAGTLATATFGTLGDTTQTWTVNDSAIKGRLLTFNSGTGSGQSCTIVSNTATALSCDHVLSTAPDATTTYTINNYASIFTGSTNQPAVPNFTAATPVTLYMEGNGPLKEVVASATVRAAAPIVFSRLSFTPAAAASGSVRMNGQNHVAFVECKISGNAAGAGLTALFDSFLMVDRSYITSTGNAFISSFANSSGSFLNAFGTLFESGGNSATAAAAIGGNARISQCTFNSTASTGAAGLSLSGSYMGAQSVNCLNCNINCTAGGSTFGVNLFDVTGTGPTLTEAVFSGNITNCPTGASVTGRSILYMNGSSTFTGTGSGTGINVNTGGQVRDTNGITFASYTNELSIDSKTMTYAAFNAFSPKVFYSSTGSTMQGANTVTQTYAQGASFYAGGVASSGAVPTIASAFGTSPSVTAGTAFAFRVNVGTGGVATTGVVTLPTTPLGNGWNCDATDLTNNATFVTDQTASTTTSASFANYSRTTGLAVAWTASDILKINCTPF